MLIVLSALGLWRYSWWLLHVIRSLIYGYIIFPSYRKNANVLWEQDVRPKQLFIMMTTFKELPTTTHRVLKSILDEVNAIDIPTQLYIGTGHESDEKNIHAFFKSESPQKNFYYATVRQKLPGKRYAIGETLRAIISNGLETNDPVVFMDGDTYLEPNVLKKCLSLFALRPKLEALTTHEKAEVINAPWWMKKWLDMRFAQRDFIMQSYSLSKKILTLTGRMSIFRGKHLLAPEFINIVEEDHLTHWLWGKFKFLSGDDKSTWYYLLKERAEMIYIPDATCVTIEYVNGDPINRMIENLRRWCGNTLRNGARAIALGPKVVGYFTWWCLIDQRITVWTMLIGHVLLFILALTKNIAFLMVACIWIAFSRLCTSCILFFYARRIDMSFPFLLYLNQLLSAVIKVYILFRLPQQKWKNRGDQRLGFDATLNFKNWIASGLTLFYSMIFMVAILLYLQIFHLPTRIDIRALLFS